MDSKVIADDDTSWQSAVDGGAVFGLEMQHPWSQHLLCGKKTIEVRQYELPLALLGRTLYIIESRPGKDGISALGDRIDFRVGNASTSSSGSDGMKNDSVVSIAGWCKFECIRKYTSQSQFEQDENRHLVSSTSGYAWQPGNTTNLYGWVVKDFYSFAGKSSTENDGNAYCRGERRKRSIFELYKT